MTPAELQQALLAVEPAAVLVSPRVLENIVRQTYGLSGILESVPLRSSFIVDRQLLFSHVEQEELALKSDHLLPPRVILLSWPTPEDLQHTPPQALLLKYWQRLFHASVWLAFDKRCVEDHLTLADIHSRIDQIGPAAFEEARRVMVQDRLLASESDDRTVFLEFAAVFLELYYFERGMLPSMFPGLKDLDNVHDLLCQDLDARELFQRTRLAGAGDPVAYTPSSSTEAHEYFWKLIASSDAAEKSGNIVRAAIQRRRAGRVAPAALAWDTREDALKLLYGLLERLKLALDLSDAEVKELAKDVPTLLDKADQGTHPPEASLLHDLQRACLDYEREIYTLDLFDWVISLGKRPVRRPLPSLRQVRITRHLVQATKRLTTARLPDEDRNHLAGLLETALHRTQDRLRQRFRPLLISALEDVGLTPRHAPERVAFHKIVEEILDRILAAGFCTFSDLRDVISRNQLKLPDLTDPQDFIRGDPLMRLDRRLATLLDGVYKPSEFYLRWLERFTSINFGTAPGRLLTRFVTLPLVGGYFLLTLVVIILEKMIRYGGTAGGGAAAGYAGEPSLPEPTFSLPTWAYLSSWAATSAFVFGLTHSKRFRQACANLGLQALKPLQFIFLDLPTYVVKHPSLRQFLASGEFQVFYHWLFKPLVLSSLIWLLWPRLLQEWGSIIITFVGSMIFVSSPQGKVFSTAIFQACGHFVELIRGGLLPGMVRMIAYVFKEMVHFIESVLFAIDDWFRFRGGDSRLAMVLRTILGIIWAPISYLLRFNFVVLVEPGLNPLKFPISSIAAKIVYPLIPFIKDPMIGFFAPVLGGVVAEVLVWWILFWSPDIAGFLFWEMKENWRLYRVNRPPHLKPVAMGSHGETVRRLVRPGFHSGTLPKLFRRLRRAERRALKSGSWSRVRACHRQFREIEEAIRQFLEREFLELLKQDPAWLGKPIDLGRVQLATNVIAVEMLPAPDSDKAIWLRFEERAGWLVAQLSDTAGLELLTPEQARTLHLALIGLYKLAGVDLVWEQLREHLPPKVRRVHFRPEGLVFWLDERRAEAVHYNLLNAGAQISPTLPDDAPAADWPPLEADQVYFGRNPITWEQWVQSWQRPGPGGDPAQRLLTRLPALSPVNGQGDGWNGERWNGHRL